MSLGSVVLSIRTNADPMGARRAGYGLVVIGLGATAVTAPPACRTGASTLAPVRVRRYRCIAPLGAVTTRRDRWEPDARPSRVGLPLHQPQPRVLDDAG